MRLVKTLRARSESRRDPVRNAWGLLGLVLLFGTGVAHAQPPAPGEATGETWVALRSDPPGVEVRIGERLLPTPAETSLASGRYPIEAVLEGFSPLSEEIEFSPGDTVEVELILLREMPKRPTASDLDLEYRITVPLRPMAEAERVKSVFSGMMETFVVMPLSLGLVLKVQDQDVSGDGMIVAGVALVATSYLLGSSLHDRKVREIERKNAEIEALNEGAQAHNSDVERAIDTRYSEDLASWRDEATRRGRVNIRRR